MAMFLAKRGNKISHMTERLFHTEMGCVIISAIFGVALAFMFQRVCKGTECVVVKNPPQDEIDKYVYQNDGICYKYNVKIVDCTK
jgi:hypothetical protein